MKEQRLQALTKAYNDWQECQDEAAAAREAFVDTLVDATRVKITQQEMAEEIEVSRQRIAQFLKERKP